MTQMTKVKNEKQPAATKGKDSLERIRSASQELHAALSDAATKSGDVMKADLEEIPKKVKAIAESIKRSLETQNKAAKTHLSGALTCLESTEKHVAKSLKSSGKDMQMSVRHALADARAVAQKISEGLAAKRTAESTHSHK